MKYLAYNELQLVITNPKVRSRIGIDLHATSHREVTGGGGRACNLLAPPVILQSILTAIEPTTI